MRFPAHGRQRTCALTSAKACRVTSSIAIDATCKTVQRVNPGTPVASWLYAPAWEDGSFQARLQGMLGARDLVG